jgi:hypothetical protein
MVSRSRNLGVIFVVRVANHKHTTYYVLQGEKVKHPITGLDRLIGFQEVGAPRFQDNRHMKVVSLSALRTGRRTSG